MSNVVSLCKQRSKPDRIARTGALVRQDWAIRQFDRKPDHGRLFDPDTVEMPAFDALLAGPASETDAVPVPGRRPELVQVETVLWISTGAFLSGGALMLGMLAVMIR